MERMKNVIENSYEKKTHILGIKWYEEKKNDETKKKIFTTENPDTREK